MLKINTQLFSSLNVNEMEHRTLFVKNHGALTLPRVCNKTSNDVTDVNKQVCRLSSECSSVQKNEDVEKENLNMEKFLKTSLNLRNVQATNQFGGGCINQGQTFIVDDNNKIYVKQNSNIVSIFFSLNCKMRNSLVMMFEIIIFLKVEVA